MGYGLGFILFENICVCFAFIDLCPQEQTTIPNDQSVHGHGGRVWLRVYRKPKCTVAALHRVKKERSHRQHPQKPFEIFEGDWDRKSSRYGYPYRIRRLELLGIASVDPRPPLLDQQRFNPDSNAHVARSFGGGRPLGHRHRAGIFQGWQLVTRGLCFGSRGGHDHHRPESVSVHAWPISLGCTDTSPGARLASHRNGPHRRCALSERYL